MWTNAGAACAQLPRADAHPASSRLPQSTPKRTLKTGTKPQILFTRNSWLFPSDYPPSARIGAVTSSARLVSISSIRGSIIKRINASPSDGLAK